MNEFIEAYCIKSINYISKVYVRVKDIYYFGETHKDNHRGQINNNIIYPKEAGYLSFININMNQERDYWVKKDLKDLKREIEFKLTGIKIEEEKKKTRFEIMDI